MALLALLISLGAFSVSILEANIMRDQQRIMQVQQKASVYPYLAIKVGLGQEEGFDYKLSILNKGVGPAKIRQVTYILNEQVVPSIEDLRVALMEVLEGKITTISISHLTSYFISPGEEKSVVSLMLNEGVSIMELLQSVNFEIDVEYCSIYDECWRTNEEGSDPLQSVQ
jgi:hypothetical protein